MPPPSRQLAFASLICIVQIAVHVRWRPFSTTKKNVLQFIGINVTALIAFGGLVLNYLGSSLLNARFEGQGLKQQKLENQIEAFKTVVAAVTIGGIVLAVGIETASFVHGQYNKRYQTARNMSRLKSRVSTWKAGKRRTSSQNKQEPAAAAVEISPAGAGDHPEPPQQEKEGGRRVHL